MICNINFTDETGTNCESYKLNDYCTKTGEEGQGWKRNTFGSIEKYLNKDNESALVCPQCGCKPGNLELGLSKDLLTLYMNRIISS